jgi:iron complex outermembrane receptor protein
LDFTESVEAWDENWNRLEQVEHFLGTTDIAYSPNVVANSILTFNHRGFELGLHSFYVGRQFFDNTSNRSRSIDPYFVNNVSLRYTLPLNNHLQGIDFRVIINNLFNVDYSSNAYGWSYYVGAVRNDHSRFFVQAGTNFLTSVTMRF